MSKPEEKEKDLRSLEEFLRLRSIQLAEEAGQGVLGTIDAEGYPYTSLVEILFDSEGYFWLLLSNLAAHTRNIKRDGRASLLVRDAQSVDEDPLSSTRASYQGQIVAADHLREEIADDYVARHPGAAEFLKFSDFSFYRFRVQRARVIAGFGRIGWVDADDW